MAGVIKAAYKQIRTASDKLFNKEKEGEESIEDENRIKRKTKSYLLFGKLFLLFFLEILLIVFLIRLPDIYKMLFPAKEEIIMSESSFSKYLNEKVEGDIVYQNYNDYEGNGNCGMFAVVDTSNSKSDTMFEGYKGELWYVDQNGAKEVEFQEIEYWSNPEIFGSGGKRFLALEQAFTTGSITYIWGVKDGKPYQPNISGKGNGLYYNQYDEIEIADLEHDAEGEIGSDRTVGHTEKRYYFYFDGTTFKEYGGIYIKEKDLLEIEGTQEILEDIYDAGNTLDSIIYRENGVININIHNIHNVDGKDYINYSNVSLRCDDGSEFIILEDEMGNKYERGVYQRAFIGEVATYPEYFPY